ncbi:tail fiber domain-containing protein [[Actinomadura] parvosata]|uniref:tail fiber domain-containing protein n=1 Tax=[Actinomadura] parvosata TaxID=1955412 RepID=UPI00406C5828
MNLFAWIGRRRSRGGAVQHMQVTPDSATPVNGYEILDKVASLPISTWRYAWEPEHIRHLGPMAQDWKATFGFGEEDTIIPFIDANGVAMVSIQALHRRIIELEQVISAMPRANQLPPDS